MLLQDEIKAFNDKTLAEIPQDTITKMVTATSDLAKSGITGRALVRGNTLPPFSLPDIHGQLVNSAEILSKGPMVVNFYRGSW